jgi:hypothetical protein
MQDIVDTLRQEYHRRSLPCLEEAANEIERLRLRLRLQGLSGTAKMILKTIIEAGPSGATTKDIWMKAGIECNYAGMVVKQMAQEGVVVRVGKRRQSNVWRPADEVQQ